MGWIVTYCAVAWVVGYLGFRFGPTSKRVTRFDRMTAVVLCPVGFPLGAAALAYAGLHLAVRWLVMRAYVRRLAWRLVRARRSQAEAEARQNASRLH